jgi:hypothetical protein
VKELQVLKNQSVGQIPSYKKVKLTDMGNIKEIMYIEKLSLNGFPVKKISKNEYIILDTGEVKEYLNHSENRSQDINSLRKTFKKIRQLINNNFTGAKNELAFTITYAENMTDTGRLYDDFRKFIMRLKYKYSNIDYMSVVEPQERGAWHCHILIRFNGLEKVYIPNKQIEELWGKGFVNVKSIKRNVDNLGAYLSAYLGDVELRDNNLHELISSGVVKVGQALNIKEVEIEGKTKKFIKGGRLHMYPPGMNIYRCSRGIVEPTVQYITYEDAKKIVGAGTPNYSTKVKILDDDGEVINSISYENYNLKREKCEGVATKCNTI